MLRKIGFLLLVLGCFIGNIAAFAAAPDSLRSKALPDSLRPDGVPDSNGISMVWQTGDLHQDYHRVVSDGQRFFVANGSLLERYEFPLLYNSLTRIQSLHGNASLFDTVRKVATVKLPTRIEDIALSDSVLIVALGKKGIRIYAFRASFQPAGNTQLEDMVEIAKMESFEAYSVTFHGDHFYVGCNDGVRSFYYDRLGFLRSDGNYFAYGQIRNIAVSNSNYLFLEDDSAGFRIIDASHPPFLPFLGWLQTPAAPRGIIVRDSVAYTLDRDFGFRMYDVGNPFMTQTLGHWNLDGTPSRFILTEPTRIAFVATGFNGGIRIIVACDSMHPHEVAYYDTRGKALDVALINDSLMLVADGRYLGLYNFSDAVPRIETILAAWFPPTVIDNTDLFYAGYFSPAPPPASTEFSVGRPPWSRKRKGPVQLPGDTSTVKTQNVVISPKTPATPTSDVAPASSSTAVTGSSDVAPGRTYYDNAPAVTPAATASQANQKNQPPSGGTPRNKQPVVTRPVVTPLATVITTPLPVYTPPPPTQTVEPYPLPVASPPAETVTTPQPTPAAPPTTDTPVNTAPTPPKQKG